MLFNSMQFCVFFPAVAGLYFGLPARWRWVLLLAASYGFYMAWNPGYAILLLVSTLVDYGSALRMVRPGARRGRWLALSLLANLGLLFFFKYYNFFQESLGALGRAAGWSLELPHSGFLLPLGISFYTFQTLSYTVDVYRGHMAPERHFGYFALYVSFFPQLVAGPIERAAALLPQLRQAHAFDYDRISSGLRLMGWGFFKKMVIADRLAVVVEQVYSDPASRSGPALLLATLCFGYQIYCDFSGYSDIAIGTARVLGVRLSNNFARPYAAQSIGEFWRRWHISLSTWFRDYVYVPLGGNRTGPWRWAWTILVVFTVSGLWHGAAWTFLVWGLLHGTFLLSERGLAHTIPVLSRMPAAFKVLMTFTAVHAAWVFFRAESLAQAWSVFRGLPRDWDAAFAAPFWTHSTRTLGLPAGELAFAALAILILEAVQYAQARTPLDARFRMRPLWFRWAVYTVLFWTLFLGGVFRQTEFIYFVF